MKIEEEQEKAIEQLKNWKAESISAFCTHDTILVKDFNKSIDIVLNLIKSQQSELEKKDKMIEEIKSRVKKY